MFKKLQCVTFFLLLLTEGDLYEDGLALKNGFFRSRRFQAQSEGSLDLFGEEQRVESGGEEEGEGEGEEENSQMEARRRKDRLEREEFIRKCRVRITALLYTHCVRHLLSCACIVFIY